MDIFVNADVDITYLRRFNGKFYLCVYERKRIRVDGSV